MTFPAEVTVEVTVEVLEVEAAEPGRLGDRPERCTPPTPAAVTIAVWLGAGPRIDVAAVLPAGMRDALVDEALERLQEAADLALLP
jgi:hypothetical protein